MDNLVLNVFEKLHARTWMIASAESCTGGLIAGRLTAVPGSSLYVDRGFITYSNQAKMEMLSVPEVLIDEYGAVSAQVAEAMAQGALKASNAQITVSVTGVAGPGGGSDQKPVGLVYVGVATWEAIHSYKHLFSGNREKVREQAVEAALDHVLEILS